MSKGERGVKKKFKVGDLIGLPNRKEFTNSWMKWNTRKILELTNEFDQVIHKTNLL